MVESLIFGVHPQRNISLDPVELDIIAASMVPIHVFWNMLFNVKNADNWPCTRKFLSSSRKSVIGVFVTYQSKQHPLPGLGKPGDTWLAERKLYVKENVEDWTEWSQFFTFRSPYDEQRVFAWSRSVQFKYLPHEAMKTDRRRWDEKARSDFGIPFEYLPKQIREQSAELSALLQKLYDDLTIEDCVVLMNYNCDYIRGGKVKQATEVEKTQNLQVKAPTHRTPTDYYQSSGEIQRPDGTYVFLPYTDHKDGESESSNVFSCKWILSAADATTVPSHGQGHGYSAIDSLPLVAVMHAPRTQETLDVWDRLTDDIIRIASTGRVSLIPNGAADGPQYSWDLRSLSAIMRRQPNGALINWQSARRNEELDKQGKPPETIAGTLEEFMAAAMNPFDSVNCLDIPTFGGEIPYIVRAVATSSRALNSTANLSFNRSRARPLQPPIHKPKATENHGVSSTADAPREWNETQKAWDGDTAASAISTPHDRKEPTVQDTQEVPGRRRSERKRNVIHPVHDPKRRKVSDEASLDTAATVKKAAKRGIAAIFKGAVTDVNSAEGIQTLEWDAIRTVSWAIVASTGAVSDTHPDAGGYLTWIKADVGVKIWAYVLPAEPAKDMESAMRVYFDMVENNTDPQQLARFAVPVQTLLTPGMLVIQPPGILHLVYTVEKSAFTCGHFYMLDAMHLTEVARACSALSNQEGTNASHPASIRLLSRIALSLAYDRQESVLRKPFISLARMLMWAHIYAPGDADGTQYGRELKVDLAAAQAVAEAILEHNDFRREDIQPEALENYHWLSRIGEGDDWTDWRDPGTARLTIPDLRHFFVEYSDMLQSRC